MNVTPRRFVIAMGLAAAVLGGIGIAVVANAGDGPGSSVPADPVAVAPADGALGDGALGDGALGDGALGDGALGDGALGDGEALEPVTADEAQAVADRVVQLSSPGRHVDVPDILVELGGDSFAGLIMDRGDQRVVSYWVGEIPVDVRRYAASEPDGLTIELLPADYSRKDLGTAIERVVNSDLAAEIGISWASAKSDGSGIEIGLEAEAPSTSVKAELAAVAGLPESALSYAPNSGMAVNVAVHRPGRELHRASAPVHLPR